MNIIYKPLSLAEWSDFETLFGKRGACAGCWCMWFRVSSAEFEANKYEGNRKAMYAIVQTDENPGILAYDETTPVGWVSVAPREVFRRLERSRILKPVDEKPVWCIVCLFVNAKYRRQGVSRGLIEAAIDYVRQQGGSIVEAYAVEPRKASVPDTFAYHGLASAYRACGFEEVARRSDTRPILRYYL